MQIPLTWMSVFIVIQFATVSSSIQAGTDINTPQTISFSSLLTFFGQPTREVLVKVTPQQKLFFKYDTIQPFFARRLDKALVAKFEAQVVNGYLDSEVLSPYNINAHLSAQTFETNIEIPTELLVDSGLYLFEESALSASYRKVSSYSGYINAFLDVSHDDDGESDLEWFSSNTFEAGLRYNKLNFTTDFAIDYDSTQTDLYRLESQFTYDFPAQGTRVTFGDHSFQSFGFQGGVGLLGVNINRNFDIIPTKNVRPLTSQQFVLNRTSTVELYIDGILIRRLRLTPGAYDVRDIPLTTGVNYIELVIIDPSGRREVISFNIATGVNLLAAGESEYSVSLGLDSEVIDNELEYDNDNYVISAGFDYGVTESFTLGANTQAKPDIYQVGGTAGFASILGLFGIEAAYSEYQTVESGYAARFNYDAFLPSVDHSFNAQYEYLSDKFISIADIDIDELIATEERVEHRFDAFYSYRFNNSWSLGLSGNVRRLYNDNLNYALTTSLAGPWLNSRANWSIRATYDDDDIEDNDEYRFFLSTSIPIEWLLNNSHHMSTSYESDRNLYQTRYSYNNRAGTVGGVGVFALVETSESNNLDGNISVDYTGNRYLLTFEHDSLLDNDDSYGYSNRLGLQTALAFSGSQVALGRPINDAFAIITPHSSLEESSVIINPESDDSYAIKSDGWGPLMFPDIVSYVPQRIEFDVENLPIGYDLGEGGFAINPLHRSAYALTIGSDANITAMGYIFDVEGTAISLTEGTATHSEDSDFAPIAFFTNSKGRFAITGLKPGTYQIRLHSTKPVIFTITIPDDMGNIIRVGKIKAERR
ncbi:fimbria/pilus outer membrane usher protein [Photobacterium sp. SDRW27]|uniref:fimbria/pilus outer membrane usher protein n=1 Tax=Photobacterium obscurum TaxID=2829490 RepID=UPI0022440751|nr:fimbria/pilus outer membrane usher protein [Photobacterium obscurum]MCW8327208.1 fimbria/pilus outer membrane usher protein [Photobacterium obscurum]